MSRMGDEFIESDPSSIARVRKYWGLFAALGILVALLGVAALGATVAVTIASMIFFGLAMVAGGIVEIGRAIWNGGRSRRFWPHLLTGVLYCVAGIALASRPAAGALALTLLIGTFFVVGGIFRAVTATWLRFGGWGWGVFSGVIGFLLGLGLVASWPATGLWAIGLFIGVDLIVYGTSIFMTSLAARTVFRLVQPQQPGQEREAA